MASSKWALIGEKVMDFDVVGLPEFGKEFDTEPGGGQGGGAMIGGAGGGYGAILLRVKVEKLKVTYLLTDKGIPVVQPSLDLVPPPQKGQNGDKTMTDFIRLWPVQWSAARLGLVAWVVPPLNLTGKFPANVTGARAFIGQSLFLPGFAPLPQGGLDPTATFWKPATLEPIKSGDAAFYADILATAQGEIRELVVSDFGQPQSMTVGHPAFGHLKYAVFCTNFPKGLALPFTAIVSHQIWGWKP